MYNLIEYGDSYSKTSRSSWQYCIEISAVDDDGDTVNIDGTNENDSFKLKKK